MIAVVDTNVVVAGLLTRDVTSPTALILDEMLRGHLRFAVSEKLIAEYRKVLLYPRIAVRHRLNERELDGLLVDLLSNALVREGDDVAYEVPDPDDVFLFQLLATLSEGVLVTGDKALLKRGPKWAEVLAPDAFVKRYKLDT